jgi:asparagine synthase (glutamine-hydrolysing)
MLRPSLFKDKIAKKDEGYAYMREQYQKSRDACPLLDSDSEAMRTSRLATWISVGYFMSSLLERKDRMSMAASVEVRVPYADHRILEYVYNIPWEIKYENAVEKALLRNAMADFLPERIRDRKKSPYPKTQNPQYEAAVLSALVDRLAKKGSPLGELLDRQALNDFLSRDDAIWFGQLMGKPQLIAWLLQFDIWAEAYHVDFAF